MRQTEATVKICKEYCEEKEINFEPFTTVLKDVFTDSDLCAITGVMAEGYMSGEINMSEKARATKDTLAKMKVYARGQLNDALRKVKELNGNVKYETQKPGTGGRKDPQLKALEGLLTQKPEMEEEIKEAITKRKAELEAEKKKAVEIDYSVLPAELRAKLGQ